MHCIFLYFKFACYVYFFILTCLGTKMFRMCFQEKLTVLGRFYVFLRVKRLICIISLYIYLFCYLSVQNYNKKASNPFWILKPKKMFFYQQPIFNILQGGNLVKNITHFLRFIICFSVLEYCQTLIILSLRKQILILWHQIISCFLSFRLMCVIFMKNIKFADLL